MYHHLMIDAAVKKPAARITPSSVTFHMHLAGVRDDALRADDDATEQAAYAVLWFCGSGRAFTGLERAGAHMTRGTVRAFLARVVKGMQAAGKAKRGTGASVVAGDLSNDILAHAIGAYDAAAATHLCCSHPYGQRFTLGG